MIAVIQRVNWAKVIVGAKIVGQIKQGYLVYLGIMSEDTEVDLKKIINKLVNIRIMSDAEGKMNKDIVEVQGEILLIPQFTLCADVKSRRPSFTKAKRPQEAKEMFEKTVKMLAEKGIEVEKGIFGAYMQVESENDGPVTFIVDSTKI